MSKSTQNDAGADGLDDDDFNLGLDDDEEHVKVDRCDVRRRVAVGR